MPALDIVIVNWNSGGHLRDCLTSVVVASQSEFKLLRICIVDNASTDDSLEHLPVDGLPLTVLRNPDNKGFAAACNQGAHGSRADYLLFLNPDVKLSRASLSVPIEFMERCGTVGITGIQLVDEAGQVARSCARFPVPRRVLSEMLGLSHLFPSCASGPLMTDWDHRTSRGVDQVMGAFFLVRRSVFEALRGFDERFFVYYEDLDFSLRAAQAGWATFYLVEAQAHHKGGGCTEQVRPMRLNYLLRSRVLYSYKHFTWLSATAILVGTLFVEPMTRSVAAIMSLSGRKLVDDLRGYLVFWRASPALLRQVRRLAHEDTRPD